MVRKYKVPYASPWWWSIFADREAIRVPLADGIELPLEWSSHPGLMQPLGMNRLDCFDLPLTRDESRQIASKLLQALKITHASGLYLSHVPTDSALLCIAIMESPEWKARIWPQSTMVCTHVPRKKRRSRKTLNRLKAVERRRKQAKVEIVDCTDWSIGVKVDIFTQVAINSPHPEWHLPWLRDTDNRLPRMLSHSSEVRSRMLVAVNDVGQWCSVLVGFQIGDRLFIYKSITTVEGRNAFAGLATWVHLEKVAIDWGVARLFLGIGLHHYKKYWAEWAEPQLGVLILHRSETRMSLDCCGSIWNMGCELERWNRPIKQGLIGERHDDNE